MEGFWRRVQGLRHMRDTLHPDELRVFDLHSNVDSDAVNANGQIMKFNTWYDSSR